MELTHASFFSGVGGVDLGLERAGFRTVSFSEIDPYACAVLAQRWPGVPNLGSILGIAREPRRGVMVGEPDAQGGREYEPHGGIPAAILWSGGFPCQDLSIAGKRRGMGAGTRSGLAFAFLELVAVHRPRAVLLENVPGLLSSHGGRDMAALIGALVELGYGVGYRVLDARHFGVPQRRRRVFILGVTPGGRAGAERAAEVLSVGSRCRRHPPTGIEAGEGVAEGTPERFDGVGPLDTALGHHGAGWPDQSVAAGHLIGSSIDPDGMRATARLAGRSHDRGGVAATLNSGGNNGGFRTEPGAHLVAFVKHTRGGINHTHGHESWGDGELSGTLDSIGQSARTATAVVGRGPAPSDGLPLGLDSHRYRCCGNGVVSDVAEWIGLRLAAYIAESVA